MSEKHTGGPKGSRPETVEEAPLLDTAPAEAVDEGYQPRTERVGSVPDVTDDGTRLSDDEAEIVDSVAKGMFTDEELEQLRQAAKDKVQADKKAEAKLALMEHFENTARAGEGLAPKHGPAPDRRRIAITIGLPKFADEIRLDNRRFIVGHRYEVTPAEYVALIDQMQWAWRHEDEIHGELNEPNRRERDTHIRHGRVSNAPMRLNTSTNLRH
jgi:hypothetical protein